MANDVEIVVRGRDQASGPVGAAAAATRKAAASVEAANLKVERATRAAEAAVKKYGAGSLEAREATQRLTDAQERAAAATERVKAAEQSAAAATDKAAAAQKRTADATRSAGTAAGSARATVAALGGAESKTAQEALALQAAQLKVERAARAAGEAEQKFGRDSIEAREASARLVRAELEQQQAAQKLAAAQREAAESAQRMGRAQVVAGRESAAAAASTHAASRAADSHRSSTGRLVETLTRFASMSRLVAGSALVALGAATASTIKVGVDYQNQLNMMQAVTHASGEEMTRVAQRARDLGNDLTLPATSAGDAAQAMTELAKGNLTAAQAMAAAKGTLQLAAAAHISGAEAAKIQADALGAFTLKAGQAGHVADVLANAANAATGEISDFAQGLGQSAAVAHQFGVNVDDTVTALALFANAGIHGSDAGTSLKSALLALASPSKQAADALKVLHVNAFDARGRFVGLESISQQLATAQGRLSQQTFAAATSTAFGSDAARAAGVLAANGAAGWDKMAASIGRSGGAAQAAGARMKGLGGAWAGLKSQLETLQIDVFTAAAPVVERFVRVLAEGLPKAITAVKDGFNSITQPAKSFTDGMKAVEDGFAPMGRMIKSGIDGLKPMGGLLADMGAAGGAATDGLKPMGDLLGQFVDMGPMVGETAQLMGDGFKPMGKLVKASADDIRRAGLKRLFFDIGSAVGQVVAFVERNMPTWRQWGHVANQAGTVAAAAMGAVASFISAKVGPALTKLVGWVNDNRFAFAAFGAETVAVLLRIGGNALIMAGYFVKGIGYIIGWWHTMLHVVLNVFSSILHGAAAAFGWIPGIGDKIKGARDGFDKFSRGVDKAMNGAATAAGKTGDALIGMGRHAVDASDKAVLLRRRLAELHSRQLVIQAIDRAKPVAERIQRAITQVRGKTVAIQVTQRGSIQAIQREINSVTGKAVSVIIGTVRGPSVREEAHGGIIGADSGGARGGLTWVGEAGRELVRLPYGSTVYPHGQSEGMAAASGGGGGPVVIQVHPGGSGLDRLFVDWLREAVRTRGGLDVVFTR